MALRDIHDFELISGARKILLELKNRGFKLILVTNQPDVSRGLVTKFFVDNINNFLMEHLELDLIKVVYKTEGEEPDRYKPAPGMIFEACNELNLDLENSFMVGDRWRDIDAGKNANCKTILLKSQTIENMKSKPDFEIESLTELLNIIN
jgi:D-glycero-D-manno-heptose 1,7-bisphosphate phosphatase